MDSLKLFSDKMWGRRGTRILGNQARGKNYFALAWLLVALTLTSCVTLPDPETTQDFSTHVVATIQPEQTVGQTFISHRARLNGIDLWFNPSESALLTVELFHHPDDEQPIYAAVVRAREGRNHIPIPAQAAPPGQAYYLQLSTDQAVVDIFGRNEDNYFNGQAYLNDQPIPADLAFQATYEYNGSAALTDFVELLSSWQWLLPLTIMLLLPGWLILDFTGWKESFDFGECLAMALGLSLAIIPLLMVWTTLAGLQWGRISVWVVVIILVAFQTIRWTQPWQKSGFEKYKPDDEKIFAPESNFDEENQSSVSLRSKFSSPAFGNQLTNFLLLSLFGFALLLRFSMVRDLAAPAWVDSIHHGLITRLILENGGLPETLTPYIPPGAENYHSGFHSNLATYIWLTDLDIHTAMQIFGQVLNALMVFPIYLLTKRITGSRPAGLTAALVVTAFTLMPAYYASWGRYTHLTGLLVLPAAFVSATKLLKTENFSALSPKDWTVVSTIFAGIFLIHYRVAAFLGLLVLAYLLIEIHPKFWLRSIGKLLFLLLLILVLLLPWFPKAFINLLLPTGLRLSSGQAALSGIPWNFLRPGWGEIALGLAGVGLVLGIVSFKRFPITVILWTGFMYLLANLGAFSNIPGAGFVNPVAMEISLFMPIAVLGGYAVGGILEWTDRLLPKVWHFAPRITFITLGVWSGILGAQGLLPTLNPSTFLAREADFPAIEWIEQNIPAGEPILINAAQWGYGLYMGNDGGYWISSLSDHPTMPPPVIYGMGERATILSTNQIAETILASGADPAALWELMQTEQIRFIYTGGRGGGISPQVLSQSDFFQVLYSKNGTWVFEIITTP